MAFDVEKEIKIFWIVGVIVLLVYGAWLFISPESYYAVFGARGEIATFAARSVGGIYIAWGIIAIILFKKLDNWEKIEEWILFAVLEQILIFIAVIIDIVINKILGLHGIMLIIINIFFVVLGSHILIQKRK